MAALIVWQRPSGYFRLHAPERQTISCCLGCSTGLRTCLRYAASKNAFTSLIFDPWISTTKPSWSFHVPFSLAQAKAWASFWPLGPVWMGYMVLDCCSESSSPPDSSFLPNITSQDKQVLRYKPAGELTSNETIGIFPGWNVPWFWLRTSPPSLMLCERMSGPYGQSKDWSTSARYFYAPVRCLVTWQSNLLIGQWARQPRHTFMETFFAGSQPHRTCECLVGLCL